MLMFILGDMQTRILTYHAGLEPLNRLVPVHNMLIIRCIYPQPPDSWCIEVWRATIAPAGQSSRTRQNQRDFPFLLDLWYKTLKLAGYRVMTEKKRSRRAFRCEFERERQRAPGADRGVESALSTASTAGVVTQKLRILQPTYALLPLPPPRNAAL